MTSHARTMEALKRIAAQADRFQLHSPVPGVSDTWALIAWRKNGSGLAESYAADTPEEVADDFLAKRHPNYDPALREPPKEKSAPSIKLVKSAPKIKIKSRR